eukprot:UN04966
MDLMFYAVVQEQRDHLIFQIHITQYFWNPIQE